MTKINICLYCNCTLIIGENWTESRKSNKLYNCRKCASAIARGELSRKDRISEKPEDDPEYSFSPHNLDEMMGKRLADRRRQLQAHIEKQMTDEVKISLAKSFQSIVRVFNIKKQSFE